MKIYKLVIALLLPLVGFAQQKDAVKMMADKSTSVVTYAMKHPMHDWEGVCKDVNSVLVMDKSSKTIEQVVVSLKVETFDSGNSNRDSHALEVLEGLKFPKVTFVSSKIVTNANNVIVDGNLTFHGVTKPITIVTKRQDQSDKLIIDGKFDVLLTDYKIERPSLFGVKTEDLVSMRFRLQFTLK